ncbi:MAG TPA: lipase family protein [Rhodothermales bacterium]|nr:lipase family protein [Rhodothermales bacterium]
MAAPDNRRDGFQHRIRALPRLLAQAPTWTLLVAGIAITLLGLTIVSRPLTSLVLLGLYIGISCIISGGGDLLGRREPAPWYDVAIALLWIAAGVAILLWLGRSIELLPAFLALLLIVSGAIRLAGSFRRGGDASRRALAASFGVAEIAFGLFGLTWPDLTLIVVAVLFGIRTIAFGLSLLWRSRHTPFDDKTAGTDEVFETPEPTQGGRGAATILRWVAAVAVLALATGTLWVSHTLRSGAPVVDAFYASPATVPSEPGTLLRYEPYTGLLPDSVSAWRILYTTTTQDGTPALSSGVVAIPASMSSGPRPVIAWAHGTVGVARACAPSLTRVAISSTVPSEAIPALDAMGRNGWAVVATDYTGMGAEGTFPYLIGEGEARSVLDGVRAARQLPSVTLSSKTVVWGHSQGGHAALWTAQIAPVYAPEIEIVGTAALSPASDPVAIASDITSRGSVGPIAIATSFLVIPYSQYYDDVHLSDYVSTPARRLAREMAARCTSEPGVLASVLSSLAVSHDRPIFQLDLTTGPLARRLAENVPRGPFTQPLLIAQGGDDEVIAPGIQDAYVASLCASGQPLDYRTYPGKSHMSVLGEDSALPADLAQWTRDRLDGLPPNDTCLR